MIKKLAVVVVVFGMGAYVLFNTKTGSLLRAYWNDFWASAEKQIPLEKRLEALKLEVKKFEQSIKDETLTQARMEVDCEKDLRNVKALRTRLEACEERMAQIKKAINDKKTEVVFEDTTVPANEFGKAATDLVKEHESIEKKLEAAEASLKNSRAGVEEQKKKVKVMAVELKKLNEAVGKLERELQEMRRQQVEHRSPNGQAGKLWDDIDKLESEIKTEKKQMEIEEDLDLKGKGKAVSNDEAVDLIDKTLKQPKKDAAQKGETRTEGKKPE